MTYEAFLGAGLCLVLFVVAVMAHEGGLALLNMVLLVVSLIYGMTTLDDGGDAWDIPPRDHW